MDAQRNNTVWQAATEDPSPRRPDKDVGAAKHVERWQDDGEGMFGDRYCGHAMHRKTLQTCLTTEDDKAIGITVHERPRSTNDDGASRDFRPRQCGAGPVTFRRLSAPP